MGEARRRQGKRRDHTNGKQFETEKDIIYEYDALRVIVTILVLLSHCLYYAIRTPYGGIDYSMYLHAKPISFRILEQMKEMIYSFHMPLFMALSGALFCRQIKQDRVKSIWALVKNKAKRLLFPFAAVAVFYSVPLKYLAGYWSQSANPVSDIVFGQLLIQGNTHLWFLPTLFGIFVVAYFLLRNKNRRPLEKRILLLIFAVLAILSVNVPVMIVQDILKYLLWFYVGFCFEEKRERINQRNMIYDMIGSGTLFVVLFLLLKRIPSFVILDTISLRVVAEMLLCAAGCYATYAFSKWLSETKWVNSPVYRLCSKNSFGIYLYSDPWNYLFLAVGAQWFGAYLFDTEMGVILLFTARFFITGLLSLAVSKILRKLKLNYLV